LGALAEVVFSWVADFGPAMAPGEAADPCGDEMGLPYEHAGAQIEARAKRATGHMSLPLSKLTSTPDTAQTVWHPAPPAEMRRRGEQVEAAVGSTITEYVCEAWHGSAGRACA
jgi:hypothetical protein